MAAWTIVSNAQDFRFRIRGILFSRLTFWLVGNFWGTGSLTATDGEMRLRGLLNSARLERQETGAIGIGNYLWHGRCRIIPRTEGWGPLYFAMTQSDYERALDALVRLGWALAAEGA
jgi:hypothetical protein